MLADSLDKREDARAALATGAADAQLVSAMRLALASCVLMASVLDPNSFQSSGITRLLFGTYVLHVLVVHVLTLRQQAVALGKLPHWADLFWYGLFVALTGGSTSVLVILFLFPILFSSFRWGFKEGARVTLTAAALFTLSACLPGANLDFSKLMLRASFLLALGYISAYWGHTKVTLSRRLTLLHEVSQLSNPRFGVDHTLTRVLEKTCDFFGASVCMLVLRDRESGDCQMRLVKAGHPKQAVQAQALDADAASPLLALQPGCVLQFARTRWPLQRWPSLQIHHPSGHWSASDDLQAGQAVADLLGGTGFISAPVAMRRTEGRIYVLTQNRHPGKSDALFLQHIVEHAFPNIENIELVDRMASEAASYERRKIALDIHDRALQPYIGLTLGLSAIRNKVAADNPLAQDLDKLNDVARKTIDDLRHYAGTFKHEGGKELPFTQVLQEQAAQVKAVYGVDIALSTDPDLGINDRMKAEVLHIVREGLSNICRHTPAQRGALKLQRRAGWLHIHIDNTGTGQAAPDFSPRSISERATALGGKVHVNAGDEGTTSVHIALPL